MGESLHCPKGQSGQYKGRSKTGSSLISCSRRRCLYINCKIEAISSYKNALCYKANTPGKALLAPRLNNYGVTLSNM